MTPLRPVYGASVVARLRRRGSLTSVQPPWAAHVGLGLYRDRREVHDGWLHDLTPSTWANGAPPLRAIARSTRRRGVAPDSDKCLRNGLKATGSRQPNH